MLLSIILFFPLFFARIPFQRSPAAYAHIFFRFQC
jgi:hypothetical protein